MQHRICIFILCEKKTHYYYYCTYTTYSNEKLTLKKVLMYDYPRRLRASQSGFQARAEEPLGTDSHQANAKWSSESCGS